MILSLSKKKPEKELEKIKVQKESFDKEYERIIRASDPTLVRDSKILSEFIFLRTLRGEFIAHSMVYARELLKEIATRFNMKLEDIVYMLPEEIMNLRKGNMSVNSYRLRKKGFNIYMKNDSCRIEAIETESRTEIKNENIIRGNIASRGKIEGFVKIVASEKDLDKVQEGDVLVTKMTSPDMTIALHRAVAIVTDEGGISCHAAIISREFDIPCIVGTKISTHVLKDGDFIRVDAEDGYVEIIKR